MLTSSDKTNVTVCVDKTKYINDMEKLLNDKLTYKILKRNPVNGYKQKHLKYCNI